MTMQTALMSHSDYDMFVIDEADQCLLELDSMIDQRRQIVQDFWDILRKKTVLLTATIGEDMENVLFDVFGIRQDTQINFDKYMQGETHSSCNHNIEYQVLKDKEAHWKAIKEAVEAKWRDKPIIVFFQHKNKIKELKKFCDTHKPNIPFYSAENDPQIVRMMSEIRPLDRGVVATIGEYGRGLDIRLKVDSFVVIGFLPSRYDNVLQMSGRSSRSQGNHKSKLIAIHPDITSAHV